MSLLELPEEVLIMIFKRLELRSKLSVALTCTRLADVLCQADVIDSVTLARSAFGITLLKHRAFLRIAPHIRHLDLSGVPHLETTWLLPLLMRMTSLRSLNVSMTNIVLLDLLGVCEQCVNLTRLTANYWHMISRAPRIDNINIKKRAFRRLEYIHLYGVIDDFFNSDVIRLLQIPSLSKFRLSAIQISEDSPGEFEPFDATFGEFNFKTFSAYLKDGKCSRNISVLRIPLIEGLSRSGWDHIILRSGLVVSMSPNFETAIFDIKTTLLANERPIEEVCISECDYIFMWHPDIFISDPMLCKTIANTLNRYRPQYVCGPDCFPRIDSIENSFIYIGPNNFYDFKIPSIDCNNPDQYWSDMNIDNIAELGGDQKFAFIRVCHIYPHAYDPLNIGSNPETYKNIVYLHFDVELDRYLSSEFLSALFKYCNRLETLHYDSDVLYIQDALVHSKSLKNLMVFDQIQQPSAFVSGVANCRSLENIHICDGSFSSNIGHMEYFDAGLSEVVEKCTQLYNLEYHAAWGKKARHKQLISILRILMKHHRDARINLQYYDRDWLAYKCFRQINPFLRIFLGHDYFKIVA